MEKIVKLFFQRSIGNGAFDWVALVDYQGNQVYAPGPGVLVAGLCNGQCQKRACEPPVENHSLTIEAMVKLEGPKTSNKGRDYFLAHSINTEQPLRDISEIPLRTTPATNLFLYLRPEGNFLVDCGAGPEEGRYIESLEEEENLQLAFSQAGFICISHGHFDHWSLLAKKPEGMPVYATPVAKEFIYFQAMFRPEFEKALQDIRVFSPGEEIPGSGIETFPIPHSVPESVGFWFRCGQKKVLHLGEYKFNGLDFASRPALIRRLKEIGRQGVDLLVLDAQNIEAPGFTISEREVVSHLSELLEDTETERRIVISCFGTNFERISQLVAIARAQGRRIVFLGTSMRKAEEAVGPKKQFGADKPPLLFIAGCQGEPDSTLAKAVWQRYLRPDKDLVILSSRAISGNESQAAEMIRNIAEAGFEIVMHDGEKTKLGLVKYGNIRETVTHDSGHASQADAALGISLTNPKMAVVRPRAPSVIQTLKKMTKEVINEKVIWI